MQLRKHCLVAFVAYSAIVITVLAQYSTPDGGAANRVGNPFFNTLQYVNPIYAANVNKSVALYSNNATRVALLQVVATYPTFVWLSSFSAISTILAHLSNAANQSNGRPIVVPFVIYNIPGMLSKACRDCSALASPGQIPPGALDQYKAQFIDPILTLFATKQSNINLVLIIEPDALPDVIAYNCASATTYPAAIAYAIAKFSTLANTTIYLDAGNGPWLGVPGLRGKIAPMYQSVMTLAKAINPKASIRGYSSNLSNYNPFEGRGLCPAKQYCPLVDGAYNGNECIDENIFTQTMNTAFASAGLPTRWLIDTSRSGQIGVRTYWSSWCNIRGAGLGERAISNPASQVDAFVWVKPPGNSDGASNGTSGIDPHCVPTDPLGVDALGGAPSAGAWFDAHFVMLVDNASPAKFVASVIRQASASTHTTKASSYVWQVANLPLILLLNKLIL
ncbi:hypothetical protein SmJEL517_g05859 [Synchytrium microbalum]|uniref:Glucanase n=1 Tax=Synchytrium microbalum TaxID=1806994 RepID=A0A507BIX5_9FUNG|nr:uncharacterized protein SmJEL517_g05859 [Synchytrium microbalum]TPX30620.1 hypothetical protein SmJEL517_g05859 [Synchytrium microbalum]